MHKKPTKPSRLRYIWTDHVDGKPSTMKIWRQIAYAMATYVVYKNSANISWDILLVYMAIVGGSELAQALLKMKYKGNDNGAADPADPDPKVTKP